MGNIPSAKELLDLAIKSKPASDVNEHHAETFKLMINFRKKYYEEKVSSFLLTPCRTEVEA